MALAVDTLRTDDGNFVTCNLYWPGQLVRFALKVLKQNDRDFMVVISLYLKLGGPFSKQHTKPDAQNLLSTRSFHLKMELTPPPVLSVTRMTDLW